MTKSAKIRQLADKGLTPPAIARKLGVTRQAVHNALRRKDPGVAIDQGKMSRGCKISVWLPEEICRGVKKAQRKGETRSAAVVRLLERGLGQETSPRRKVRATLDL